MYLAYFDESGDHGVKNSPTRFFVLGCILVSERDWTTTLNHLIRARRHLRAKYKIPTTQEVKASHFRSGGGTFRGTRLGQADRFRLLEGILKWIEDTMEIRTFAVAIEKQGCVARGDDPRHQAWRFALQRVNRFCKDLDERAMIFPDAGHGQFIRRVLRKVRRHDVAGAYFGSGMLSIPAERLVEDPNERISHESYLIQLADWLAYTAHRSSHIDPNPPFPDGAWDLLGSRIHTDVNKVRGGPPGLVVWP